MASVPSDRERTRDRHVRRSGNDYATQFLSLLPQGQAWPRDPESTLVRACLGLNQYWGYVDGRAADLLVRESDPRKTVELLEDWERAWGLPDECFQTPQTIGERQRFLVFWMTLLGGQSREWFVEAARLLGYGIRITEYAPYVTGISRVGDHSDEFGDPRWEIAPGEIRFYWKVHVDQATLQWFRVSEGEIGVDPHLIIGIAEDLECLINRWKPAHTDIVYDYSHLQTQESLVAATLQLSDDLIAEGSPAGTEIGEFFVTGGSGTYSFSLADSVGNRFAINGDTLEAGAVATDFETGAFHTITVTADNGVDDPIEAQFTITVINAIAESVGTASGSGVAIGTSPSSTTPATGQASGVGIAQATGAKIAAAQGIATGTGVAPGLSGTGDDDDDWAAWAAL